MAIETVTSGPVGLPATSQLSVTPGNSWAWGSYVEAVASTAAEYALIGFAIWPNMTYEDVEVAVAAGAGGAEADIAVYRLGGAFPTNSRAYVFLPHGPIAAGTRLSVRARQGSASLPGAQTIRVMVCPTTGIQITSQVLAVVPSGAASIAVAWGGSSWTNGAWVEFIASAASDLVIATLVTAATGLIAAAEVEIDVGIGSAGNEVVVGTWRYHIHTALGIGISRLECDPLWDVISSGDRVSLRCRATANISGSRFALETYAKPL